MSDLKPCLMCGCEHKNLMGYDYHKVSCANVDCPISHLALTKEQWNTRAEPQELTTLRQQNAELVKALTYMLGQFGEPDGSDFLNEADYLAVSGARKLLSKIKGDKDDRAE
ncbi:hypothetical protein O1C43_000138 [Vibrio cholerae]|nr:hypothetical protein [Vibrio cholerae]EKF9600410.1 hypothetical protein [Vibrio cholerae]